MRFLLDEMFSLAAVAALRGQNLEASHVRDHGLAATDDAQILEVACVEGWILVTANLRDFRSLHPERVAAGQKVAPLLLLTQRTLDALGGSQPDAVASLIAAWAAANPAPYDGEHWLGPDPDRGQDGESFSAGRQTPVTLLRMVDATRDPGEALQRLQAAADDGRLAELSHQFGLRLLVAFGSATEPGADPADLDLAYLGSGPVDLLDLLSSLYEVTGYDDVDPVDLDRAGIVLRAEALCGVPLYEAEPGLYATEQMNAVVERMDTRWLRQLDLEAMSG